MLSQEQLKAIDRHLRQDNWLLNDQLIAELTDHYAAGLEDRLAKGSSFDEALRQIHTDFGGRKGLLKMEEDFQVQQFQRYRQLEYRIAHSFVNGSRVPISICLFAGLCFLNTQIDQQHLTNTVSNPVIVLVAFSVAGNLLVNFYHLFRNRCELNATPIHSSVFSLAYLVSFLLLMGDQYLSSHQTPLLTQPALATIISVLETICCIFIAASLLALRHTILNDRKNRVKTT